MRTTHMGHPRSPNSRGAQPASVNADTNFNAHDLIVGLASKDREAVDRFTALDVNLQVIVAKAAFAWMRQMSERTKEERDLKSRTILVVHRHIRLMRGCPAALQSLRVHLAPICWEMRRNQSAVHKIREARRAHGPVCQPITEEDVRAYAPPKTVLSAAPATLSASA